MCKAPLRVSGPTMIPVCDHWNRGKTEVLSTQDRRTGIQGQTNNRPLSRLIITRIWQIRFISCHSRAIPEGLNGKSNATFVPLIGLKVDQKRGGQPNSGWTAVARPTRWKWMWSSSHDFQVHRSPRPRDSGILGNSRSSRVQWRSDGSHTNVFLAQRMVKLDWILPDMKKDPGIFILGELSDARWQKDVQSERQI